MTVAGQEKLEQGRRANNHHRHTQFLHLYGGTDGARRIRLRKAEEEYDLRGTTLLMASEMCDSSVSIGDIPVPDTGMGDEWADFYSVETATIS